MMSEDQVLQFWDDQNIFKKSIDQRDASNSFVFYDGPPFATGLPHYGHILASTIKDVIPRFWTMKGKRVERKWGWDCHGLPIENIIEQKLGLKTRKDILNIGVDKFNEACRACVLEYAQVWKKTIRRMGRWVDMEHDYKTMDPQYMESIWSVFKALWDKGLIYEGYKAMHLCPRCETTLANFEVTQGYKDVTDISVVAKFELEDEPGTFLLSWTTTPWTLPGNSAIYLNKDVVYVKVKPTEGSESYILAKDRVGDTIKEECEIVQEYKAQELVGKRYRPLFNYFVDLDPKYYYVDLADFVTLEQGTGLVHSAIMYGEVDFDRAMQQGLKPNHTVGRDGKMLPSVKVAAGMFFKSADKKIIEDLEARGLIYRTDAYTHSYPHCWRCETPLLNYASTSWFLKVTSIKDRMIELNQKNISWVPQHFRDGRFGKWLEGARDWAISRSRFWGTPLPVWRSDDGELLCIGSVQELEALSGVHVTDLHKHKIDDIVITKDGKEFKRIPEVLDCWFESGSMPYAQLNYRFDDNHNQQALDANFPAEFIGEGQDQTRGWFYTLHVLSTALKDSVAFRNVIVNGIVLAEDGKKMSKRLKNYPEPNLVIDKYGADAMRMYLCLSPAMEAENLNFSEKGVDEVYKKVTMLAGNVLKFWELYAPSITESAPLSAPPSDNALDQWIVAKTQQLLADVDSALTNYHIPAGARPIVEFLQDLSTWYVRRSRDRVKEEGADRTTAVQTLGWVLRQYAIALAPFMPMLADGIYQRLPNNDKESVHLLDWPTSSEQGAVNKEHESIVAQMETVRRLASSAHQLRAEAGIKVRQPLQRITIKMDLDQAHQEILKDEVNIKEVTIDSKQTQEVVLDTTLTPELKEEGLVRDLVRLINAARKSMGLTIQDRVAIRLQSELPTLSLVIEHHAGTITDATLATSLSITPLQATTTTTVLKEFPIDIVLEKQ